LTLIVAFGQMKSAMRIADNTMPPHTLDNRGVIKTSPFKTSVLPEETLDTIPPKKGWTLEAGFSARNAIGRGH
jgi:hypothetical protein